MNDFVNRHENDQVPVCVVTGGSSGIGLATCIRFATEGYRVALCGRDENRLKAAAVQIQSSLAETANVRTFVADVGHDDQARAFINDAIEQFGRIDVLVNNAGIAPRETIAEFPVADFRSCVNVNIVGSVATIQAAWHPMVAQESGTIVNISSMSAVDPFPGMGMYGATKAFVESLTLAAAREGEPSGIRAYAIRPGAVETPLLRRLFPDFPADQCVPPSDIADRIFTLVQLDEIPSGSIVEVKK